MKKPLKFQGTKLVKSTIALILLSAFTLATAYADDADDIGVPRLTEKTKYLKLNTTLSSLEFHPVSEGIFAFQNQESNKLGFWTIDGKCLFPCRFEMASSGMKNRRPLFDNGAAVVKDKMNAKGFKPIVIVYANGSIRELPESYKEVSQFHDGVATVSTGGLGVKQTEYFCINTKGDRIWASLGPGDILEVGYLRDGLRRVKVRSEATRFTYLTRWGFIDDEGKWIIKPTFRDVREFKNGYALVISEDEKMQFINTKGEVVYQFEEKMGDLYYARGISDVSDGYFMREMKYNDCRFFDLTGKCVAQYPLASGFTDGYAFVKEHPDSAVSVIDTSFKIVRNVSGLKKFSSGQIIGVNIPEFGSARLGTINKQLVLSPDGRTVISPVKQSEIGNFIPDRYAPAEALTNDLGLKTKHNYLGYINSAGEFEIVFIGNNDPGSLTPADSVPEKEDPPITTDYEVKVVASPPQAGQVSGSGKYQYDDIVKVGARQNEGWRLTGISSDNRFSSTSKINEFTVRGDMVITVHFIKDDILNDAPNGIFLGDKKILEINDTEATGLTSLPIYLETSSSPDIKSPYGDATHGFMALMLDPDQTLIFKSVSRNNNKRKGTFSLNAFFVPMKVTGQIEENGQKYLVLDGGVMKTNNMRMLSSGAQANDVSALESLMVNLMLMFDGADANLSAGSYRIEMNDIDPTTGAFTFGMMQRLHPQFGWIAAGSDAFKNIERGFFIYKVDTGFPADYFNGIRMTPSQKRDDVLWAPTPGFFEGNKSQAEEYATSLGKKFREYKSEYQILQNINMEAINNAFDAVLKPKK